MKKVLIASDDAHTAAMLRHSLSALDLRIFDVSLSDMTARLAEGEADLVVLDGGRSADVLAQGVEAAAASGIDVRLLLLVEAESLPSLRLPVRVPADFVVRGATAEEVLARVRALLWPGEEASSQELLRFHDLTVNLATYQAYLGNEPVDFTYLEYALFTFLVTHPGRAYSREVLLRRVWGSDYYGGSRTVDVHIRRIRAKIGAEMSRHLETVRNVGYLWRQ